MPDHSWERTGTVTKFCQVKELHRTSKGTVSKQSCPQELAALGLDFSFTDCIGVMSNELVLNFSFSVSKLEKLLTELLQEPIRYAPRKCPTVKVAPVSVVSRE